MHVYMHGLIKVYERTNKRPLLKNSNFNYSLLDKSAIKTKRLSE